jgi:hypothetical protein
MVELGEFFRYKFGTLFSTLGFPQWARHLGARLDDPLGPTVGLVSLVTRALWHTLG